MNYFLIFAFTRLNFLMKVRKLLTDAYGSNNSLDGLIGEVYAEHKLGMIRMSHGHEGIDGHINGRSVQVKTKGGKKYKDNEHYIEINSKHIEIIDDLLMVFIKEGNLSHVGPIPLEVCEKKDQKNGKLRIYLDEMKRRLSEQ